MEKTLSNVFRVPVAKTVGKAVAGAYTVAALIHFTLHLLGDVHELFLH